ncbi:MAG: carboxypeptidase regulatory-like domain-containing protein, partial [Candidatus Micrarchaeia archaeon]
MAFEDLKARYDSFCDGLAEKGVPNPRVLVPVACLAILALVFYSAGIFAAGGTQLVELRVADSSDNPVPGASVTLFADGAKVATVTSNSEGIAAFEKAPAGAYTASVEATGYTNVNKKAVEHESRITLSASTPAATNVVVKVKNEAGAAVSGAQVSLAFTDGVSRSGVTDSFGEVTLSFSGALASRATLSASKTGYGEAEESVYSTDLSRVIIIELGPSSAAEEDEGRALVIVKSASGNFISGILVTLVDPSTGQGFKSGYTDSSGVYRADAMPVGRGFRVNAQDPAGDYVAYTGTEEYSAAKNPSSVIVQLAQREASGNALEFKVSNEDGVALQGANVRLYDEWTASLAATASTDAYGKASFSVASGKAFYATVYLKGYLPARLEGIQAGQIKEVALERERSGNYLDVPVHTQNAYTGEALSNALVDLYSFNGFPLGTPSTRTAAGGIVRIRVPAQTDGEPTVFYAVASRDYWHGQSDASTASEGLELFVSLEPEPGTETLTITDLVTGDAIAGAAVKLVADGEVKSSCVADDAGECVFAVAPEQEYSYEASASGYLVERTATRVIGAGEDRELTLKLYPSSLFASAAILLEGVYDSDGNAVQELANAQDYEARFLVVLPSSGVTDAKAFFKLGSQPTVEEEIAGFTEADCPSCPGFDSGSAFDELCSGTSGESESELLKWYSLDLPEGYAGAQEVILHFTVKPEAQAGDEIVLHYRLQGYKNSVPFLSPADESALDALLDAKNSTEKAFCLAETTERKLAISNEALTCGENACYRAYFESMDGSKRGRTGFRVAAGEEYYLYYEALSLASPITSVTLEGPEESSEPEWIEGGEIYEAVPAGEKTSGKALLTALRATRNAPFTLSVGFEDDYLEPAVIALNAEFTGTNSFQVAATPRSLVAGLNEYARVTVLDQFGSPVTDAELTFYDCEGAPLDGQELDVVGDGSRNYGEDGKYKVELAPASHGSIGLNVERDGFQPFEECLFTVHAGDFVYVEPSTIEITDDDASAQVSLLSLLPDESTVTTSVSCPDALYVSPQSFTLRDEATVQVRSMENASFDGYCTITFKARLNPNEETQASVYATVELTAPEAPSCPSPYSCLSSGEATARGCETVDAYSCPAVLSGLPSQSCYACETGVSTLPTQISLTVSNTRPTATETFLIALDSAPEECRVEGFTYVADATTQVTDAYYSNPYSTAYAYQPSAWAPQSNPYSYGASAYDLTGYYSYANGASNYYAQGTTPYGSASTGTGYGTAGYGYNTPAYCPQGLNQQTMYGYYGASQQQNAWDTTGLTGTSLYCQYPQVCQNYAYCALTGTSASSYPLACQYPAVCSNPQACGYPATTTTATQATQNVDSQPPVRVTIDACSNNELQITAEYTGADYSQNAGVGGVQEGFILVKTGPGAIRRVPVTVTIEGVTSVSGQSAQQQYQFPQVPSLPPECLYGMQSWAAGNEDLNAYGLPDSITVYVNPVNGYGRYERTLPVTRVTSCRWEDEPDGAEDLECGSKLVVEIQLDEDEIEDGMGQDASIKAYVAGALEPVEIQVDITEDDLEPAVIQLLTTNDAGDEAVYDFDCPDCECDAHLGSTIKIECDDEQITASVEKKQSNRENDDFYLEVTDEENYAIHRIPVAVAIADKLAVCADTEECDYTVDAITDGVATQVTLTGFLVAPDYGGLTSDAVLAGDKITFTVGGADNSIYSFYPEGGYAWRTEAIQIKVIGGTPPTSTPDGLLDATSGTYLSTNAETGDSTPTTCRISNSTTGFDGVPEYSGTLTTRAGCVAGKTWFNRYTEHGYGFDTAATADKGCCVDLGEEYCFAYYTADGARKQGELFVGRIGVCIDSGVTNPSVEYIGEGEPLLDLENNVLTNTGFGIGKACSLGSWCGYSDLRGFDENDINLGGTVFRIASG